MYIDIPKTLKDKQRVLMNRPIRFKPASPLLALLLTACGGEETSSSYDGGESGPTTTDITIQTQNTLDRAPEGERVTIDLSEHVRSNDTKALTLTAVTPMSDYNHCDVLDIQGLTFKVSTSQAQVCRYDYRVEPSQSDLSGTGTGISQVVVSDAYDGTQETLTPISKTVTESKTIDIDVSETLPSGFALDEDSLDLTSDMTDPGEITVEGNIIRYTAPEDTAGTTQIYYTAVNETTAEVLPGLIHIAVSLSGNTAPVAQLEPEMNPRVLTDSPDGSFEFDVAQYVVDAEGDNVQLIDVYTHGLGFADIHPLSTAFTYTPNGTGTQSLTYVVTDHRGGVGVGTLVFEVDAYYAIYDASQDLTFEPTYTQEEISAMNGVYSDLHWENGTQGEVGYHPVFDRELAEAYCQTRGLVLPTRSQLSTLFTGELAREPVFTSQYQWPSGAPYIASDGWVSLSNGQSSTATANGYVFCIQYIASASDYSFTESIVPAQWDSEVIIAASAETSDGNQVPLPTEAYDLQATVVSTLPEGRESQVNVDIDGNRVTVSTLFPEIKTATVTLTDPSVQGSIDEVSLVVGLAQCDNSLDFETMQRLGCVPVIHFRDTTEAFTGSLTNNTQLSIGFDCTQMTGP